MFNKARFRNKGLLMAITAQIILVAQLALHLFGIEITEQIRGEILALVDSVLVLATYFGLVNDPTTENKWFKDDQK
ncbi:holin [Bacillus phage BCD7]|uniref:Putative holin n=1 Tax=Bacillus phage BCD7 TaxID=1136534 RepID=J9PUD5_9CAUD|nr:holin [Bacillus phage BCD7]AEZ50522.1 putative holin [Bacillus phage BCD7]